MNTNKNTYQTISELRKNNLSWADIAKEINKQGLKTATGKVFSGSNAASVFSYYHDTTRMGARRTQLPQDELNTMRSLVGRLTVSQRLNNKEWLETIRAIVNF